MFAIVAEQFMHEIGGAVDDLRNFVELRAAIDKAAEANAAGDAIECPPTCRFQSRDQIERANPRRFLAVGKIIINPDAADIADLAIPLADLSGKENKISDAPERHKIGNRYWNTGQFDRECRQP